MMKQRLVIAWMIVSILSLQPQAGIGQQQDKKTKDRQSKAVIELREKISQIIGQPQFATTRWGILIESLDREFVFFSQDADQLFTPASNMKLYTTAAALARLAPDFRFRTSVYASAKPDERGHVEGDLIIYGRGDPNLTTRTTIGGNLKSLYLLADQLYQAGVREVMGDLVGDDSYFTGPPLGTSWEWDDLQWYYGAEVSALSVDDNAVELFVQPGESVGDPVQVLVKQDVPYVKIVNRAVTVAAGTEQRLGVERGLADNQIEITGTIPLTSNGYRGSLAIHQPALYAAMLLKEALARRGIRVSGRVVHADWKQRRARPLDVKKLVELAAIESMPLADELRILNKISQNLHAEILLRTLGAVVKGEGADEKGLEVIAEFLRSINARVKGVRLRDGSGLARVDVITPAASVDLLRFMAKHDHREIYRASLPVAGVDGTLERRMIGTRAETNVQAKTGTLAYTITLAGYVTTAAGERLAFSLMANNHTGSAGEVTRAADQMCVLLAEFQDKHR